MQLSPAQSGSASAAALPSSRQNDMNSVAPLSVVTRTAPASTSDNSTPQNSGKTDDKQDVQNLLDTVLQRTAERLGVEEPSQAQRDALLDALREGDTSMLQLIEKLHQLSDSKVDPALLQQIWTLIMTLLDNTDNSSATTTFANARPGVSVPDSSRPIGGGRRDIPQASDTDVDQLMEKFVFTGADADQARSALRQTLEKSPTFRGAVAEMQAPVTINTRQDLREGLLGQAYGNTVDIAEDSFVTGSDLGALLVHELGHVAGFHDGEVGGHGGNQDFVEVVLNEATNGGYGDNPGYTYETVLGDTGPEELMQIRI